jgi:acyl-CoA dehydrogenase
MEATLSETGALLAEMTERLLSEHVDDATIRAARVGNWPAGAWQALVEQGLPLALVENDQGFGIPLSEGLALIRLLGRRATPLPIAETMAANMLLARAGLSVSQGVVALVPDSTEIKVERVGGAWHVQGVVDRIAWGRNADALLIASRGSIALATSGFRLIEQGQNVAAMPRDRIEIDAVLEFAELPGPSLLEAAALVRSLAMAGALEAVLSLTLSHITQRVQFGQILSTFQVVQHSLARLGSEVCAASVAADLAADAFAVGGPHTEAAVAAARSRISDATATVTSIAHQMHGAMGFTAEHRLHWFTTALWSWRDEFGTASWWTRRLGETALVNSKQGYWPFITSV